MLERQECLNEGTLTALISTESLVQQDGCDNHTQEGKLARAYNITPVGVRLSDFRVKKSYIELIALYVHPKNSNHPRSHLTFLTTNLVALNQPTLYFIHDHMITSEVKQCYEALFLSYRPETKCSISQLFKTN